MLDVRTQTTTRLIEALGDPASPDGAIAWSEFDARYRPILFAFAMRLGFHRSDAEELAQATLAKFAELYRAGRYDRQRGRLRSMLLGVARNIGLQLRQKRGVLEGGKGGGDTIIDQIAAEPDRFGPDDPRLTQLWEAERQRAVLAEAMERLRASERLDPRTVQAFELFALRGVPAEEVARSCEVSVDSVYVIKNRLTTRLRGIVANLTAAYDEGE